MHLSTMIIKTSMHIVKYVLNVYCTVINYWAHSASVYPAVKLGSGGLMSTKVSMITGKANA